VAARLPILVTGAAGSVGGVGRRVAEQLLGRGLPVRAFVRRDDERAAALRAMGAEIVVGDLTRAPDLVRALDGCRSVYFALSVSPRYLEAAVTAAAAARDHGHLEVLVDMSQMTVSQMTLTSTDESGQQRLHWLAEQAFDWSGVPVTHIRPTVFMENPLFADVARASIERTGTLRLPFGTGRTSPVAARDVADVVTAVLVDPAAHIGRTYELTGAASLNGDGIAAEYAAATGRDVTYTDVPLGEWADGDLAALGLPAHVGEHIATMARLHADNRYDRLTGDVRLVTGHPPTTLRDHLGKESGMR
jgi:NAD(P)H dehydrogenase (quinone)